MKKIFVLSLLLLMVSATVEAQKDYIAPFFSYGFGLGKTDMMVTNQSFTWSTNDTVSNYSINNHGFSLGDGYKIGLIYGHHFNEYVGLELGIDYYQAQNKTIADTYIEVFEPRPEYNVSYTDENIYSMKTISAVPMVKMTCGFSKFNPYVKCGVVLAVQFLEKENLQKIVNHYPGYMPFETTKYNYRFNPRFNAGGIGVIGIDWISGHSLNIYSEVQLQYLEYTPSTAKIVEARYQNESFILDIDEADRNVVFVDQVDDTDLNMRYQTRQLKFSVPLSGILFSTGIRISLSSLE